MADGAAGGVGEPQGRVVLLVTSPRVAPGLLSWPAWEHVRAADAVLAADLDDAWHDALHQAGVRVDDLGEVPVAERAGRLVELADEGRRVVWLGSPDGDPGLTDALAEHLSRRAITGRPPEVELLTGSYDVPGSRLLDLVAVMDRLRSPGGCPWDAEQTHASLAPYLLEEAHEVLEAIDAPGGPDRVHLREELGDLLLQVAFHARVAQDDEADPFDIDEVAAGIVAKLVRRHPHVFGSVQVAGAAEVEHNWEQIKAQEKQRAGAFDGIPSTLPALARAQKMLGRLERAGRLDPATLAGAVDGDEPAARLLDAVRAAGAEGVDAESRLRSALARLAAAVDGTPH